MPWGTSRALGRDKHITTTDSRPDGKIKTKISDLHQDCLYRGNGSRKTWDRQAGRERSAEGNTEEDVDEGERIEH